MSESVTLPSQAIAAPAPGHAPAVPDDDTRLPRRSLWRLFTRPYALLPGAFC